MSKRLKAALLLSIWVLSLFSNFVLEVSGAELSGSLSIKNNIIELLVNKEDGRFAIKTVEGSPDRLEDENAPLLFSKDNPATTFTTFRIDGKDYIYGNSYNGISINGGFVEAPKKEGMVSISNWRIGDIEITQKLEMTDNINSSDVGNVKISYSITNSGSKSRMVGTRVLLDTMLGSNDGSVISLNGEKDITSETEAMGEDIPVYWRCTDSADNPKVVAYGFMKGWGNTEPDKMTIAHWNALSSTKWDYSTNSERNIGSSLNDYKSADSAVALYWEPKTLEPGKTTQVETYYGLGNIKQSTDGSTFKLNVLSPAKLSIEGDIYKDNPFDIMMELDNSLKDSTELAGITAELILPEGLELDEGQEGSKYFYRVPVNLKQTAAWKVKAVNTQKLKVLQYMVRITSLGKEIKNIKKFIIVPGFENNDFDIGYTDIVPRNLYYNDEDNAIQLIGYGFDKLKDKTSYEMSLINTSRGNTHYPSASDITIVNDNQIRIRIPKGLEVGAYKLAINHQNDMLDYDLPQKVMVTSEEKYKSRNYGILVIKEHSTKLLENESQLSAEDKSSAILIIRGKVKSVSEGRFDVYGDTIAINNDIYYKGYVDNTLSVYKSGDSFIVKGNGELYMQSALLGKSMEITLKKGRFYIDLATAIIKDEAGYINDISTMYVGYFPILVKEIKVQNNGEAKIDGILQLENKYFNFLTSVGAGFIESDLKGMSITNKKIDINTEFTIPFPRWKLGNFQSKDYLSKPTTQITFFINTIKGAYGFKTKAQNLNLRLRDINAKMAFDKNLYPDYFEFENKYGSIPEPIGSTGLAFESIGGGIYGLKSMIDSLRYGILPTGSSIAARADIVDLPTYHARIKGYTMIGLRDIEALLSSGGIDLKGDGYIYFIDVGDIIGHFDLSGGYIQADVDILDILIMEAYFGISKNEIKGSVSAEVKIPNYVWFVGGKTIADFKAGLSTSKIEGSVKFLGVGVGIKYKWLDNDVDFDVASLDYIDEKGIYTVNTKDDQGRDVVVTYGANIERIKDVGYSYNVAYSDDMIKTLALGTSSYNYEVEIGESAESAIIEMKYDSSTKPEIEVKDPDGNPYILIDEETGAENANYRNHIISADKSSSGVEEKRLFVTIISPKSGEWTIKSDKLITMTLYNAKEPAVFKSLSAKQEEGKIKVDWELNKTDGSKVALYLIKEDGASESIEIIKDLAGALRTYECNIPAETTTGSYKIRAEVERDGTGFDDMYSEVFEIVDAAAPEIPTNFKVVAAGDGMMEAQWDGEAGVDEYRIYAVDNEGKIDKTVEAMISVDGDKTNTIIGGTLFDADAKEYGWLLDRTYKFALYAISKTLVEDLEAKEIEHISKPSYSGEVYLPAPEPPEFTVGFTSEYGNINIEKDQDDNGIRYTNTRNINCNYQSDMSADVIFYINGNKVDETENKDYSLKLELNSGSNMIEIEAVAGNGDKTVKAYDFYYDDKAPDLMVQSPNSSDIIQGGSVLISGKTTSGSMLYVNGTQMLVAEDGSFNEEYILSNIQRETITIASVDLAGNRTEYSAEVLNSDVNNVVKVQIMPSAEQLRVGDSVQMRLYGVTKDNKNVLLESDKVDWLLYDTEGVATMTEGGLLTAVKAGEIIVNGKYIISMDTIYEDALIMNVMPRVTSEDNDSDTNNDSDRDEDNSIAIISSGTKIDSLLRKLLDFKANEEITIPGLMRLRFTGNEVFPKGYIEVLEIKDLIEYRQQSGNKDFRSNIFDIKVPEGFQFNSSVELTLYFDKNKVKNLKHIAIYVYNEKTGIWNIVGGAVDEKNASITVKVPHFSKYAVMENRGMTMMTDMDGHWARDAVYRLIDRGIVNGIKSTDGEYRFEPDRTVTRAEFAKMLSLSRGYGQSDIDTDLSQFTDVEEILPWAQPYIKYCYKKGWINGKSAGTAVYMKPNDTITRAEAASMLGRTLDAYQFSNYDFIDKEIIPQWAQKHVILLSNLGIMKGYPDHSFRANDKMTRDEAAALFDNYLNYIR